MSLWEKWEREKLEQMGIEPERKSDVEIHDMRLKPNVRMQLLIVAGALLVCFLTVYFAMFLNEMYGGDLAGSSGMRVFEDSVEQNLERSR